jgi:hypothetical protein
MEITTNQPQPINIEQLKLRSENECSCCCCVNLITILPICLPLCPFTVLYNCSSEKKIILSWYPTVEHPNDKGCCCIYSQ